MSDEQRLAALSFVRPSQELVGLRSRRQTCQVYFHGRKQQVVALGFGGDVFVRPNASQSDYSEMLEKLLRPPVGAAPKHPREANKPYYEEADLSDIARRLAANSDVLKSVAPLELPAELPKSTFYDSLHRLSLYEQYEIGNSLKHVRTEAALKRGFTRPSFVNACHQGDGTPLDYLVLDNSRSHVLGRLHAVALRDSTSDQFISGALSFDSDSLAQIALMFRNALCSKAGWRERFGIESELLPGRLAADYRFDYGSGFLASPLKLALFGFGVTRIRSQKGRPSFKGQVESGMMEFAISAHELPGSTSWDWKSLTEHYDYDPKKDAFITLDAASRAFYRTLFDVHNHHRRESLGFRTPHEVYKEGLEAIGADYDEPPSDDLLTAFLASYYPITKFSRAGIMIDDIPYQFEEESTTYRELLGRTDHLLATRDPWDVEFANIVDLRTPAYWKLRVAPQYRSVLAGMSEVQLKAMVGITKAEQSSVDKYAAHVDYALRREQVRRDTIAASRAALTNDDGVVSPLIEGVEASATPDDLIHDVLEAIEVDDREDALALLGNLKRSGRSMMTQADRG